MTKAEALRKALQIRLARNAKYIQATPHPRQEEFLCLPHREALYGGAAGGG